MRRIIVALIVACVAGCAVDLSRPLTATVTPERMRAIPADVAQRAAVPGKSTRADVRAALGETQAIRFDTGYEVWAYRVANTKSAEFVVLFGPSGTVAKTRVRPDPQR